MNKAIYDYRKGGLKFLLYPSGAITVSSRDLPERRLYQLDPRTSLARKSFNALCRDGIREGDVDDVLQAQARLSAERGAKRKAGEALYAALEGLVAIIEDSQGVAGFHMNGAIAEWDEFAVVTEAYEALAQARGERH